MPDAARERWRARQPLFSAERPPVTRALFREALVDMCLLLPPGETARSALNWLLNSPPTIDALLENPLAGCEAQIQQIADAAAADPGDVAYLLRVVLSPFYQKQAAPYQEWVEAAAWRRGICPICGSEPWMARLTRDNGQRILICSLCRTEWVFDRLRCPFCDSGDQFFGRRRAQPQLRHFTVTGDEARRVDCCDQCYRYIKTVDERVSALPINLSAEDVITVHLDALAQAQGYQ